MFSKVKLMVSTRTRNFVQVSVYLIMVCAVWTQTYASTNGKEGFFVPLNLDGYKIKSPLKTVQVQTIKQCILVCLDTTGCTAVGMFNNSCQPFDGEVQDAHEHIYSQGYLNKELTVSCNDKLTLDKNVEILKIYPYLHGFVTLTCSYGYIYNETTMTTGSTCNWTGSQPTCHEWYQWGNNSYVFVPGLHNWSEAYTTCKSFGGRLTDIQSTDEHDLIIATINQNSYPDSFWIGGFRLSSTTFAWVDTNETVIFDKWRDGNPDNNGGHEDCICLWGPDHLLMIDLPCGYRKGYICKIGTL